MKNKLLTVLSDAEQFALYGLPDFDDRQRLTYLSLSGPELALASSRPSLHAQVWCALFRDRWDFLPADKEILGYQRWMMVRLSKGRHHTADGTMTWQDSQLTLIERCAVLFRAATAVASGSLSVPSKSKTDVIREHWNEILRLVASLKGGIVLPSAMLKRLAAYQRQNQLDLSPSSGVTGSAPERAGGHGAGCGLRVVHVC